MRDILKSLGNFILPSSSRYGVQPGTPTCPPMKENVLQITFTDGTGICNAMKDFEGDDIREPWYDFLSWYDDPNGSHCFTFVTSTSALMLRRVDIKTYSINII